MTKQHSLAIIGPGKVGTAIAVAASKAGFTDITIAGRDIDKVHAAAQKVPGSKGRRIAEAAHHADIVLLTVSDSEIELVCKQMTEELAFKKGTVLAHLSGALDSSVLKQAKVESGVYIASAHPMQTFPSLDTETPGEAAVPGAYWFLEGDAEAVVVLTELIEKLGGTVNAITSEGKAIYHAASVVACNYLSTLMDTAIGMMKQSNVDEVVAWKALKPLVFGTLNNIDKMGPEAALTGPIERGDVETITKHRHALDAMSAHERGLYSALGLRTVQLAMRKGAIDANVAEKLNVELKQIF